MAARSLAAWPTNANAYWTNAARWTLCLAREYFGLDCDRTRIALDVTPRGITGFAARDALTRMGIDIEMADARRIVMICSAVDDKDKFDALIDGLKRLSRGNGNYALPKVERVMRGGAR